jgi:Regulator of Chromosome Condensation (RCC1) repeat protein/PASTA domain-containing protein
LSTRPRPHLRLCALAVLSVGLLSAPGAAGATPPGNVVAWGCSGDLNPATCAVPAAATSGVTAIAAGVVHSLALKQDGSVLAWGCGRGNDHGQCTVPAAAASGVTAIAAEFSHSLALKQDGSVIAWGCGSGLNDGQCAVPPATASGVTAIGASTGHGLALKQDGSVIAWGCGSSGTINRDFGQCNVPAAAASGVTAIAAGDYHSLALKQDGSVIAWGCGFNVGQCTVPAAAASGVTAIGASIRHSVALKHDGSVIAWGCGDVNYGQCTVPAAAASGVAAIAAGEDYNLALKQDGSVIAWGCGSSGTIGRNFGQCNVPAAAASGVTAIAAGVFHSLALVVPTNQTITFGALANKTYGDPDFSVSATASSGLAVSFAASGNCTVSAATVHLTGAGSCTVTASQAGNVNYNPAPDVSQSFAVAKAGQTITFGPLAHKKYGAPDFRVSATASSGLAVSFAASGRCTVRAATVHLTGAGSCTVTASQPGDANYNAAPNVSRTFSIARPPCRVPKVVGKRVASAKRTIAQRRCRTGKVGYAYSRKRTKGIVISQSRRPGRVLPARSKINLIVSRGRRR